jgi:uncharacterized protein (DUF1330 family)
MAAYLLADVEIRDPGPYAAYRRRFDGILARYGGRILINGGSVEALEGEWRPRRLVVLEFPSADHARVTNLRSHERARPQPARPMARRTATPVRCLASGTGKRSGAETALSRPCMPSRSDRSA